MQTKRFHDKVASLNIDSVKRSASPKHISVPNGIVVQRYEMIFTI